MANGVYFVSTNFLCLCEEVIFAASMLVAELNNRSLTALLNQVFEFAASKLVADFEDRLLTFAQISVHCFLFGKLHWNERLRVDERLVDFVVWVMLWLDCRHGHLG